MTNPAPATNQYSKAKCVAYTVIASKYVKLKPYFVEKHILLVGYYV